MEKKNILAIIGSASQHSNNLKLVENIQSIVENEFNIIIFNELKTLPHFAPELSENDTPQLVLNFRNLVKKADGVLICTPEYIFSIPSGLKNAIEWSLSSMVFSDKPLAIITASANGEKAHEELQLIMKTVMAKFTDDTTLLIQGIKGKINNEGQIIDNELVEKQEKLILAFSRLINKPS